MSGESKNLRALLFWAEKMQRSGFLFWRALVAEAKSSASPKRTNNVHSEQEIQEFSTCDQSGGSSLEALLTCEKETILDCPNLESPPPEESCHNVKWPDEAGADKFRLQRAILNWKAVVDALARGSVKKAWFTR